MGNIIPGFLHEFPKINFKKLTNLQLLQAQTRQEAQHK